MPTPFSRTLRHLEADRYLHAGCLLAIVGGLLFLWSAWFVGSKLAVYALSSEARLEAQRPPHSVVAPVAGRIATIHVETGRRVEAGAVLFDLEADLEESQLAESTARLRALEAEFASLRVVLASEEEILRQASAASRAARAEAAARYQATVAAAALATEEARRSEQLYREGIVAEIQLARVRAEARRQLAELEGAERELEKLELEAGRDQQRRQAELDRLRSEVTVTAGEVAVSAAALRVRAEERARRRITAPVAGYVAEVTPQQPGAMVLAGESLATVIPADDLKVVAFFDPGVALGRVRPGQPAEMRLDGFPWSEYGAIAATVQRVAGEPRQGRVRVECSLVPDPEVNLPLQHGLPGVLAVEVDRLSPVGMVLHEVGKKVRGSARASRP